MLPEAEMLSSFKSRLARNCWNFVINKILKSPEAFADSLRLFRGPEDRKRVVLNLLTAAARGAFTDRDTRNDIFYKAERFGVHLLPAWYKSPVPDSRELLEFQWEVPEEAMSLLDMDSARQLNLLTKICKYCDELSDIAAHSDADRFHWGNPAFGPYDACVYYCLIRHLRPRRIVEVGSGYSTLIALKATQKNGGVRVTCVEPHPAEFLRALEPVELLERKVQSIPLDVFSTLEAGDFLFVDGSHISKTGSDVNDVIFRILPSLSPGVVIHFHDIFVPFEYPRNWVTTKSIFYSEQYTLLAFLLFNRDFDILLANHLLSRRCADRMRAFFHTLPAGPVGGSSFWFERRS